MRISQIPACPMALLLLAASLSSSQLTFAEAKRANNRPTRKESNANANDAKPLRLLQPLQALNAPKPAQTYYVPLPENDLAFAFDGFSVVDLSGDSIHSLTSVAVGVGGTIIWYDHWEDGYEEDVTFPAQATTQIYGDGDPTNGCIEQIRKRMVDPPDWSYACDASDADHIGPGEAMLFTNENPVPTPRDSSVVLFDGADVIRSSFPIAVSRGAHPNAIGPYVAGAVEIFADDHYGTKFVAPVGQDTLTPEASFGLTELYVMASNDGTEIRYDGELMATLNEGQTYVQIDVQEGKVLEASKPVQVDMLSGHPGNPGTDYEMRWYALLPFELWSNDYYTPVSSDSNANSVVWIYNPNTNSTILVHHNTSVSNDTYTAPGGVGGYVILPNSASGSRFYTDSGENFFAMTVTDHAGTGVGQAFDWGHPLIPASMLTSQALVGWGYGCSGNLCLPFGTPPNDFIGVRNVVWVTPVADADVHVDYNGNGTIDQTISAAKLQQIILTDEGDDDMTGAFIFANDTAGNFVEIATAWGQKPSVSGLLDPYGMDMGTVVMPIPEIAAGITCSLFRDNDVNGKISAGDELKVNIRIAYTAPVVIHPNTIDIIHRNTPLFDQTVYVSGSTSYFDSDDNIIFIPDDISPASPFPLDAGGIGNQAELRSGTAHQVTFRVTVKDIAALTLDEVESGGRLVAANGDVIGTFSTSRSIHFDPAIEIDTSVYAGHDGGSSCGVAGVDMLKGPVDGNFTFCYVVANAGNTYLDTLTLGDEFADDYAGPGGVPLLGPGDSVTLHIEETIDEDKTNTASIAGRPVLHDGYDLGLDAVNASDSARVEMVSYDITLLDHCENFNQFMNVTLEMRHFAFVARTGGCINVRVFTNDRPLDQDEVDGGMLDHDWKVMCLANVQGEGPGQLTDVPSDFCTPAVVQAGETKHFYIAMQFVDQSVCDEAAAAIGASFDTVYTAETEGPGVCPT